jgi:hypothetical protein
MRCSCSPCKGAVCRLSRPAGGSGYDSAPGARAREGVPLAGAQVASRRKARHGSSRTVFHEGSGQARGTLTHRPGVEREAGQCYSSRENHQPDRTKPAQHDGPRHIRRASRPPGYRLAGRTATLYDPACRRSVPGTCGPGRMRWFQHTVPDLTGRWIPAASHPQRDGALQPGAGGPLPWHLHVISTGSTADLHTGLVGCGDIDDGGVGQGSHDPVGIAAVGLVHPGGLGSDPVQRTEYSPSVTPGPAGPAHRHAQTGGRACC